MKFDDLDAKMRVYERSLDQIIPPENYLLARIDGRSFTRLTKEVCKFEAPFDERFNQMMVETVKGLVADTGMEIVYGYTQSDEISLLFGRDAQVFGRKVRKLNSILAGAASARFSLQVGLPAVFDCRIIPLPNEDLVADYFRWRMEDAHRNCLNSWCYWSLRKEGRNAAKASEELEGKSIAYKNEFLFQRGINFNDLPVWQKRGVGVYWRNYEKVGHNPITGKDVKAIRREVYADYELAKNYVPIDLIK
ncbi:MAG: hypothetical protein IJ222_03285 [Bacteroidales bacterium]|nr:hypothetical protein [Bacteroidales bacterium]